ncbi:MAG: alpha/beta hydrolase, partial [Perlucidibaca sp.]
MPDRVLRGSLKAGLRLFFKAPTRLPLPHTWLRRGMAALSNLGEQVSDREVQALSLEGVPCERHGSSRASAVLYLHGGAFFAGSPRTHRVIGRALARALGASVFLCDYRLAPEHPHPAALEDALAAWQGLLAMGYRPDQLIIAGDSAGGGLALSLTLALRDQDQPLPLALLLVSPLVDLSLGSDAMRSMAARDPMLSQALLARAVDWYRSDLPADDPQLSPIQADLTSLPPMLIQVGSEEVLLDDALALERQARAAGVCVECQIWPGLWHDFQ